MLAGICDVVPTWPRVPAITTSSSSHEAEDRRKSASWTTSGENGFLTPKHAPTHPRTHAYAVTVDRAVYMTGETRRKKPGRVREGGRRIGRKARTDVSDIFKTNSYIHALLNHARPHMQTHGSQREMHTHTHQRRGTDGKSHTWRENAIRDAGEGSRRRERER